MMKKIIDERGRVLPLRLVTTPIATRACLNLTPHYVVKYNGKNKNSARTKSAFIHTALSPVIDDLGDSTIRFSGFANYKENRSNGS